MATIPVKKNEATAARRRVYFHCVDVTDGITPEAGEAGGQPQLSADGAAWTNTGIGTLSDIGNGRYYADLTQAIVNYDDRVICTRYKSANTAECVGDTAVVDARLDLISNLATDTEVAEAVRDVALAAAAADSFGEAVMVIQKHILNKLTRTDNGDGTITYKLYDDNSIDIIKTWVYTTASTSRAKAS